MKELPYFKFYPGEWMKGDITDCSIEAQGLFINICVLYWMKAGSLTATRVQRKFNSCSTHLQELIDDEIIVVYDDEIHINFLDEQFDEFETLREHKIRAGKASAKKRKGNSRSTGVQQVVNNKEERRGEKIIKEKRRVFSPPTLEEVREYCLKRGNSVDAKRWFNHYTANGWMVGRNKMKDWQASVRTWEDEKVKVKIDVDKLFDDDKNNS